MRQVGSLVVACMWDLVPLPGIEPGPPALGAWSLIHCATREVPCILIIMRSLHVKVNSSQHHHRETLFVLFSVSRVDLFGFIHNF